MNREQREGYEQRLQRTLLFNPPVEIQTQTLEGSPVFFSQGLDTPFFSSLELLGALLFLFAVFARFAVKITMDTPLNSMNHEQHEGYEQGGLQGTPRFSGEKGELSLRGKPTRDTPFFISGTPLLFRKKKSVSTPRPPLPKLSPPPLFVVGSSLKGGFPE